jgi:hypothetical protein
LCTDKTALAATESGLEAGLSTSALTDPTEFLGGTSLPDPGEGVPPGGPGFGGGGAPANTAPVVSLAQTAYEVTMPQALLLSATVTDDGLPEGYPLQILWYTEAGPAIAVGTALASRLGPPPAQIRACRATALGSCLGS